MAKNFDFVVDGRTAKYRVMYRPFRAGYNIVRYFGTEDAALEFVEFISKASPDVYMSQKSGIKWIAVDPEALMEAKDEEIVAGMQDVVAEAQVEIDGMVADLKAIADYSGALETKIDQLAAAKILEKIGAVCGKCLEDCGTISGCTMVADDGYYPNLEDLYKWGGSEEPEEIAEDIRYEIEFGEKPLGLDREEYQWMLEDGAYAGLFSYPAYIQEDLKDFATAQASVATLA